MKKCCFLAIAFALFVSNNSSAQLIDKIKNKVKNKADEKVDKTIDKQLDKVDENGKSKTKTNEDGEIKVKSEGEGKAPAQSLKAYSRFDFVPGDKIVYADDFGQEAIGEFPSKWNTNGNGEVMTIEGLQGRWLRLIENTQYETPYNSPLPENYTIEFDLLADFKDDQAVPYIKFQLQGDKKQEDPLAEVVEITIAPNGGINVDGSNDGIFFESRNGKGYSIVEGKKQLYSTLTKFNHKITPVHVALWIQKQRIRVWINQDKMYDLPKGLGETMKLKKLGFEISNYGGPLDNYGYYISNLKVAVAPADTRNKLITEGKWSTTGILFDINSDKIKPTSYGTLKEIATVLTENADVKVKIVGHTDSDGDDAQNLELSKKRAASVKETLVKEFNIDAARLETDGKGEIQPIADNKSPEGKAQNRRVEFLKL